MKRIMKKCLLVLALSGCAVTNTGIVKIADETYMVGEQDKFESFGTVLKARLYRQANEFCSEKGRKVQLVNDRADDQIGNRAASAEVQFRCQ